MPTDPQRAVVSGFLTSRRARLTPRDVGLPNLGEDRRVPGLRRQEVAALAGVSPDYYTRLERGRIRGASDSVLNALARALRLDDVERAYLFALAHGGQDTPEPRDPAPSLRAVLAHVAAPALATTAAQDIIGANLLGRALYDAAYREYPGRTPNLARFAFTGSAAPEFYGGRWDRAQVIIAAMLRMESARHPADLALAAVVAELTEDSEDFRTAWGRHDVHEHRSGTKTYHHPAVGDLPLTYDVLTLPGVPGTGVTVYGPQAGTDAHERLAALADWARSQDFAATGRFPSLADAVGNQLVSPAADVPYGSRTYLSRRGRMTKVRRRQLRYVAHG